jgi:hypothetical protein
VVSSSAQVGSAAPSDLQTIAENGAVAEPGYVAMTICHSLSVFWRSRGRVREVGRE